LSKNKVFHFRLTANYLNFVCLTNPSFCLKEFNPSVLRAPSLNKERSYKKDQHDLNLLITRTQIVIGVFATFLVSSNFIKQITSRVENKKAMKS